MRQSTGNVRHPNQGRRMDILNMSKKSKINLKKGRNKRKVDEPRQTFQSNYNKVSDNSSHNDIWNQQEDVPLYSGSEPFESLSSQLSVPVMAAVRSIGFATMRNIQAKTIPLLLQGHNLRGTAATGTGKTLAFLIPALDRLIKQKFDPKHGVGLLIISPTRELALQIQSVLTSMLEAHTALAAYSQLLLIGGKDKTREVGYIRAGTNIVIATPGRLLDHLLTTKQFSMDQLNCLVLDEADRILSSGFQDTMEKILHKLPSTRQSMLFSATRGWEVEQLTKIALGDSYKEVDVTGGRKKMLGANMQHEYVRCPTFLRLNVLQSLLKEHEQSKVMVFFNNCKTVMLYHKILKSLGFKVDSIHGKKDQGMRSKAFLRFQSVSSTILLCTDVAARGWDIQAVDIIIQVDPPVEISEFAHRVGRAARQEGTVGQSVLLLRPEEIDYVRRLKREHNVVLAEKVVTELEDIQSKVYSTIEKSNSSDMALKCALQFRTCYSNLKPKECFNMNSISQLQVDASFGLLTEFPRKVAKQYLKKHDLSHMHYA